MSKFTEKIKSKARQVIERDEPQTTFDLSTADGRRAYQAAFGGWGEPDPATLPNERDARVAGAEALANAVPPPPPHYGTQSVHGGGR